MKTLITANMLRESSSPSKLKPPTGRPLFYHPLIITVLLSFLVVSACSFREGVLRQKDVPIAAVDSDEDSIPDTIDNCPTVPNNNQADLNGDGWGDVCDDIDGDLIADNQDAWPLDPENDFDNDGIGADPFGNCRQVCESCTKLAEICLQIDNCPYVANDQKDFDKDGIGDVCDSGIGAEPPDCNPVHNPCDPPLDDSKASNDADKDNVPDSEDNCQNLKNPYDVDTDGDGTPDAQLNTDNDAYGDPCDDDDDNDGVLDDDDNCRVVYNTTQDNLDCDSDGDLCDSDRDGDGYLDSYEISTHGTSPTNADTDGDSITDGNLAPICPEGLTAGPDQTPLGDPQYSIALEVLDPNGTAPTADIKSVWLPAPEWDMANQKWKPDHIRIKATLTDVAGAGVPFTGDVAFEILNPSNHEGIATNDTETYTTAPLIDFCFNPTISGDPSDAYKSITTTSIGQLADLYAFDFGGHVTIKVTATNGGSVVEGQISLPLDSDFDTLPDEWENANAGFNPGNANTFSTTELDGAKDVDTSMNNAYTGDGLTNFQEYRGIIFDKKDAGGAVTYTHKRLNPMRKDLFVRGDNFANSIPENTTPGVLAFSLDYASVYGGQSAFKEAEIDVHNVTGLPSFFSSAVPVVDPPNIDILVVTNKTEPRPDGYIETIMGLENGYINHPSALKPRYWTWDLKGASYIGNTEYYAIFYDPDTNVTKRGTFTYHLCLMHYFYNRPYKDYLSSAPAWQSSDCYSQAYEQRLDPLDSVEDWVKENGQLDPKYHGKIEDKCVENSGLESDRMDPVWKQNNWGAKDWEAGWHFSAFDAEGDGRVENPIVLDSDALDPNQPDPGEYTADQVQLHTVLHEMGHAVGMDDQHTADPDCLMYQQSINWSRAGHFSPAAQSQILIHNKTE